MGFRKRGLKKPKNLISAVLVSLAVVLITCFSLNAVDAKIRKTVSTEVASVVLEDYGAPATTTSVSVITKTPDIPAYSGTETVEINGSVPFFTTEDKTRTDAFESYSPLDKLGRCGVAYANVCIATMPTEERGEIGQIKPSGWHTVKYNGVVDGNYLYNRCHLIGYQLTGENANEKNLITGTRYLNIQGMLDYENKVASAAKAGKHVLYRVTPIYTGKNLLADGVLMEAYSVEDKGKTVQFCVFSYNIQPGIVIDYANGNSCLDEGYSVNPGTVIEVKPSTPVKPTAVTEAAEYILNKNTKKIHKPSCSSVSQMAEKNKKVYTGSLEELQSQGYEKCKKCF